MKGQLKWADVAHMYINSEIQAVYDGDMVFFVECRANLLMYQYCEEARQDFPLEDIDVKPILRHLEDMTEDQAKDMYAIVFGDPRSVLNDWKRSLPWANDFIGIGKFEPRITVWLLSQGFDLFGLIESGEAIRKEASNEN